MGGSLFRVALTLEHKDFSQWLQPLFTSYLGAGAATGFVGKIEVLEHGGIPAIVDAALQFGSHLLLLGDGLNDGLLAFGNILQPLALVADSSYLNLVETASALLAVTRYKGYGASLLKECQRIAHYLQAEAQVLGNQLCEYTFFHIVFLGSER